MGVPNFNSIILKYRNDQFSDRGGWKRSWQERPSDHKCPFFQNSLRWETKNVCAPDRSHEKVGKVEENFSWSQATGASFTILFSRNFHRRNGKCVQISARSIVRKCGPQRPAKSITYTQNIQLVLSSHTVHGFYLYRTIGEDLRNISA